MAAGQDGSGDQRQVLLEALYLRLGRRHARRAHSRIARDRCHWTDSTDRGGLGDQENVPRRQLAVSAKTDHLVTHVILKHRRPAASDFAGAEAIVARFTPSQMTRRPTLAFSTCAFALLR